MIDDENGLTFPHGHKRRKFELHFIPPTLRAARWGMPQRFSAALGGHVFCTHQETNRADLLRLKDIRKMGTSIGGAWTFDGIFITGIVAVLLA